VKSVGNRFLVIIRIFFSFDTQWASGMEEFYDRYEVYITRHDMSSAL
jgi:hypothetical protein